MEELSQYDVIYIPKEQLTNGLADFIVEFSIWNDEEEETTIVVSQWKLFIDGASNEFCSGAKVELETSWRAINMVCSQAGIPDY